jgi:nucleoside transporter
MSIAQHESNQRTPWSVLGSLGVMMFLQYAVWGVWLPVLPNYLTAPIDAGGLGFSAAQMGWILGLAGSLGAIFAPFIAGQLADRVMNAERALAGLLAIGGAIKIATAYTTSFPVFLALSIFYSICYMPTLSLTNSICFQHLSDSRRQFPPVRMLGTLGWIAASSLFTVLWLKSSDAAESTRRIGDALLVSGGLAIAYAIYAFIFLPKTPPRRGATEKLAFAKAFGLLRGRGMFVLSLVALPIAMVHQVYFFHIAPFLERAVKIDQQWLGPALSIGQWSEIVFLTLLALFIKRIGFKGVLLLGCAAYVARFAIFASTTDMNAVLAAQVLHGLCYGCFFAGAFLFVEHVAPPDVRHSAQTVFGIVILGLGPVLAGLYNEILTKQFPGDAFFEGFWTTQAIVAAVAFAIVLVAFPLSTQRQRLDSDSPTTAA